MYTLFLQLEEVLSFNSISKVTQHFWFFVSQSEVRTSDYFTAFLKVERSNIHELPRTMVSYRRCPLEVNFLYFSTHCYQRPLSKSSRDRSIMVPDKQNLGEFGQTAHLSSQGSQVQSSRSLWWFPYEDIFLCLYILSYVSVFIGMTTA